jgi:hypothetical protein
VIYKISGTQFNGLSQACSYGDDAQMATNYPLVRITRVRDGAVSYLRTFNHSTMAVATGGAIVSTHVEGPFVLVEPPGAPGGVEYSLRVVANGIASDPVQVNIVPTVQDLLTFDTGARRRRSTCLAEPATGHLSRWRGWRGGQAG